MLVAAARSTTPARWSRHRRAAIAGADAVAVELDVADPASIERLALSWPAWASTSTCWSTTRACALSEGPLAIDETSLALEMATNVYGPWLLMRVRPGDGRARYGRVVNVSSGSGSFAEASTWARTPSARLRSTP